MLEKHNILYITNFMLVNNNSENILTYVSNNPMLDGISINIIKINNKNYLFDLAKNYISEIINNKIYNINNYDFIIKSNMLNCDQLSTIKIGLILNK